MRNAECGIRNLQAGVAQRTISHCNSALRIPHSAFVSALLLVATPCLCSAQLPPLPNTDGRGVHVLALAADRTGSIWVGTYGQGIYALRPGATAWEHIAFSKDSSAHSISWDFVHAFAFGPHGEIWYGTVGNERLGSLDRQREDVDQLGIQAARSRMAVRGPQRDRDTR